MTAELLVSSQTNYGVELIGPVRTDPSSASATSLVRDRFFVRRGKHNYFQQDPDRAHLAANSFTPRWQKLLDDDAITVRQA